MIINNTFKNLIPPLSEEERTLLEESICKDGCRDPLVLWGSILIDGHNRFDICSEHNIPYDTVQMEFDDEDDAKLWIIRNQLGRRNIPGIVRAELALKLKPIIAEKAELNLTYGGRGKKGSQISAKDKIDVRKEVAKAANISHDTVSKVEKILKQATPEQVQEVREGKNTINRLYKDIRREERREEREQEYKDNPIPVGQFDVILADPPWRYDFNETKSREIESHYPTMSLDDICELEVPSADNTILFLWVTVATARQAFKVLDAWGFKYRSQFVWDKEIIGMGYFSRVQHELLYVATKGDIKVPQPADRYSSVISERRTKHSKKPSIVHEMIEKMYPGKRYLEMFAREKHNDKWEVWGNEIS